MRKKKSIIRRNKKNPVHFADSEYRSKQISGHILQLIHKISMPASAALGTLVNLEKGDIEGAKKMLPGICLDVIVSLMSVRELANKLGLEKHGLKKHIAKINEEIEEVEKRQKTIVASIKGSKRKHRSRRRNRK